MYDQVLSATRYALSLKETALRFVEAGLPATFDPYNAIAAGRLDCIIPLKKRP